MVAIIFSVGSSVSQCSNYMVLNESDRNVHHGGCGDNGAEECWSDSNTGWFKKCPNCTTTYLLTLKGQYELLIYLCVHINNINFMRIN